MLHTVLTFLRVALHLRDYNVSIVFSNGFPISLKCSKIPHFEQFWKLAASIYSKDCVRSSESEADRSEPSTITGWIASKALRAYALAQTAS